MITRSFTEDDKKLIYSFKKGNPDWGLFPYEVIKDLPAVKWKLLNINKLIKENTGKHNHLLQILEKALFR